MTPERAAFVFRELMQTPTEQLSLFSQRAGLVARANQDDLERARELLFVLADALDSGAGPPWARVKSAWTGLRQEHGLTQSAMPPKPPKWVRELPPEPSLGDPAPGTAAHAELRRKQNRFVPAAQPAHQGYVPEQSTGTPPGYAAPSAPAYGEAYAQHRAPAPHPHPQQPYVPQAAPQVAVRAQAQAQSSAGPPPPPRRHRSPAAAPQGPGLDFSAWTVSKYAAFCAACSVYPERVQQTQHEYGILDEASRRMLDDHWSDVFDDDAAAQQQWEQLVRQFRSNLQRG